MTLQAAMQAEFADSCGPWMALLAGELHRLDRAHAQPGGIPLDAVSHVLPNLMDRLYAEAQDWQLFGMDAEAFPDADSRRLFDNAVFIGRLRAQARSGQPLQPHEAQLVYISWGQLGVNPSPGETAQP